MTDQAPERIEISIGELVASAVAMHKLGRLPEAEKLYRAALEVEPGRADALHFLGLLAHQTGHGDDAVALISKSLDIAPDVADWHNNLGNIHQRMDRLEAAVSCYRRALALQAEHADTHNNLGVCLNRLQRQHEAEDSYKAALRIRPDFAVAHENLANLLSRLNRISEAVQHYCTSLTLKDHTPETRRKLAIAYCMLDQRGKAIALCEDWLAAEPDNPQARHAMASVSGRNVPLRASDAYVEGTFDGFAGSFEANLERLEYRAPALIATAIAGIGLSAGQSLDVLDAGCGTGLCGALVAPYARRLTGVDLSEGMLQHARRKGLYHELIKAELTAYLRGQADSFDLIVSADTLVYFGALEEFAAAAAGALRPGGHLLFTVEEALGEDAPSNYCIRPHGRYNHRVDYVERCLAGAGLAAKSERAMLRMEAGKPVAGLVVSAGKPPPDPE